MMAMKSKVDSSSAEMFVEGMGERIRAALVSVASDAIVDLRRRVAEGRDIKDDMMPTYTKGYQKARSKKGRPTQKRDLSMTGKMLGSIHLAQIKEEGGKYTAVITLSDARSKRLALYHQKTHRWFGWSPSNKREIKQSIKDNMAAAMGGK